MSQTNVTDVANQISQQWSPIFTKQLRDSTLLAGLVNRDYEGAIREMGDRVYVSQINKPTGENRTVGTDADVFATEALSTSRVTVQANKRAVAAFEFEDLVWLQSQIDKDNPEVFEALFDAVQEQINDYLYASVVAPSTSAPDHEIGSVTDLNLAQLAAARVLAGEAKWRKDKPWYGLLSPAYYGDVMDDATLGSRDFGADDAPVIGGQLAFPRMGFNLLEDNSRTGDYGLLFHPDFMHLVMQSEVRFKISDMHAQKKFGFVMSVDVVYGATLGVDGANKHIRIQ
jgi:hypothetical protein